MQKMKAGACGGGGGGGYYGIGDGEQVKLRSLLIRPNTPLKADECSCCSASCNLERPHQSH